jgi:hypothetical protein
MPIFMLNHEQKDIKINFSFFSTKEKFTLLRDQ